MATIQDVAKQAGVSIATVSRVINGTAYVNAEITTRVREVAKELEYQPSRAARALRGTHTTIIGLLISDIQNPFFITLIRAVEEIAQNHGYSVLLCNSDENPQKERRHIEVLCSEQVAGAIIVPTREQQKELRAFQEHGIPLVAVDRRVKDRTTDAVLVDNKRGAYEGVTHLISNGYRRIGIITGPLSTTTGRERLEGYRKALEDAAIPHDPNLEQVGSFQESSGELLASKALDLEPRIDALFVANNLMTLGALETIHKRNLRIPEDVAIVGFDEMPWAALSAISLTTVTQPVYEIGSTAALRLLQRIENPGLFTKQEIILTSTLRIRGSSRPRTTQRNIEHNS